MIDEKNTQKPSQSSFDIACQRYREMRRAMAGKPFDEQKKMINNFRAGL